MFKYILLALIGAFTVQAIDLDIDADQTLVDCPECDGQALLGEWPEDEQ